MNYKQLKKIIGQIREQMVLEQQSGNATHGAQHRPTFSICTTRSRGGNSLVVNHKGQPHDLLGSEVEESYQTELLGPLPWLEREEIFFSRLDSQLNMVNNFYKTKEREFLLRSKQLEVQLETLVEIRGQLAACKIGDQDDSDKETDICRFDRCRLLAIWVYRGWEWKRNDNSSVSDSSLSVSDRGIQRFYGRYSVLDNHGYCTDHPFFSILIEINQSLLGLGSGYFSCQTKFVVCH